MKTRIILLASALLALNACSSVKQELGVGRNSPDEFAVVKRAPLTLPPDYALRPPMDGAPPPSATAAGQARAAVLGAHASSPTAKGGAEEAFMGRLGAQAADPGIRARINADNGYIALQNRSVVDRLIAPGAPPAAGDLPASVVDAQAEKDRLEKNKTEDRPVNDGDVPVIEKKPATIDKIF